MQDQRFLSPSKRVKWKRTGNSQVKRKKERNLSRKSTVLSKLKRSIHLPWTCIPSMSQKLEGAKRHQSTAWLKHKLKANSQNVYAEELKHVTNPSGNQIHQRNFSRNGCRHFCMKDLAKTMASMRAADCHGFSIYVWQYHMWFTSLFRLVVVFITQSSSSVIFKSLRHVRYSIAGGRLPDLVSSSVYSHGSRLKHCVAY